MHHCKNVIHNMSKLQQHSIRVHAQLVEEMVKIPMSKSAITCQAVMNSHVRPELLSNALRSRLADGVDWQDGAIDRIGITYPPQIKTYLTELSDRTRLPMDEVVRLAIEAYVKKL